MLFEKSQVVIGITGQLLNRHAQTGGVQNVLGETFVLAQSHAHGTGQIAQGFAATDTAWAPWFVARSDDKKRARLNIIGHLLSRVPYKPLARDKVKLPRRKIGRYKPVDYPFKMVPERN